MSQTKPGFDEKIFKEAALLYVGVIGCITLLYQLRFISWIRPNLMTLAAVLLIYPALFHVRLRRIPIRFFEKGLSQVLKALKYYLLTALGIFPVFLACGHFYQTRIFGLTPTFSHFPIDIEFMLTQILLVAFPEEFFFRGYIQSFLSQKLHKKFHFLGIRFLPMTLAVPATSLLFALSHSAIAIQWWHFAIFFPGLVFGWLRERTDGLIAPTLFHATSNILMAYMGTVYR